MNYVIDIEANGIEATKIHCLVAMSGEQTWKFTDNQEMTEFLLNMDEDDRIVGHNFQRYDKPVIERILNIKLVPKIYDTLALSWYLFPDRSRHGLEAWGEDLGIAKPKVEDWENLSITTYLERCEEDVKINKELWHVIVGYLTEIYGSFEQSVKLLNYLSFKMYCAELQEKSGWKLDVEKANSLLEDLHHKYNKSVNMLKAVMPKVEKKAKRNRPAKPYKANGELSKAGERWKELTEANGLDFEYDGVVEEIVAYQAPNPGSSEQVKEWLYSLGWEPTTFKFNGDRKIPQVKDGEELCSSVKRLSDNHPEVLVLDEMTVVKHRIGLVQGLIDNEKDGYVTASIQGLTNTLRFKHAVCVNLPSLRKPYGKEIRELLTSSEGNELCGSDMSSLEDRTKQHYMWDFDPEYVKTMMEPDYDPHIDVAIAGGMISQEEGSWYKKAKANNKGGKEFDRIDKIRHLGKTVNYSSTYGAGVKKIAMSSGMSQKEARTLHTAYWKRNWAIKAIADSVQVKNVKGKLWLYNPVSQLYYSLRHDKDRFSTLNQSTGTFCFDMWLGFVLKQRPQLTGQFHDEFIIELKEGNREKCRELLGSSISRVNKVLRLNRDLDCDIQFGDNYSMIH